MPGNAIEFNLNQREFNQAIKELVEKKKAVDSKFIKSAYRRNLRGMVNQMKQDSHSARLVPMISITTAKRRAGPLGARVGVTKNDASKFPDFSAQALASVLEYGTEERFRNLRGLGLITGRQSTGRITPKPFLRPAFDAHVRPFMDGVTQAINKKLK